MIATIEDLAKRVVNLIGGAGQARTSLDNFVQMFSAELDKIIIDKLNEGGVYRAGRLRVVCRNDECFDCYFEMYFDAEEDEIIEMSGECTEVLNNCLIEHDLQDLRRKREIVYEIDEPV